MAAPREHIVRLQPNVPLGNTDTVLRARVAREEGMLGGPSILTLASTKLDNEYGIARTRKTHAHSHPLRFACVIGGVCWRFYQGADPAAHGTTRGFVTHNLQPHVVVRLNAWEQNVPTDTGVRAYTTYGPRISNVLYVPDIIPEHVRNPAHEDAVVRLMRELFELLLSLTAQFPASDVVTQPVAPSAIDSSSEDDEESSGSSSSSSSSELKSRTLHRPERHAAALPRVVYIHCFAGRERSRFVMTALHGALYALDARVRNPSMSTTDALRAWADRQACFRGSQLSLRLLLTHKPDDMFPILARTVARLAGLRDPDDLERVVGILYHIEQGSTIRGNYHNVCAAGAQCPSRHNPVVTIVCKSCHAALFCNMTCFMAANHVAPLDCTGHFDPQADVPKPLKLDVLTTVPQKHSRVKSSPSSGAAEDLKKRHKASSKGKRKESDA